jgi:hypothetical protein
MKKILPLFVLLLALSAPYSAGAGVTLFVSPDGDNGYILEGDNIGAAQVVEVAVQYDPSLLGSPQVSLQGATLVDIYDGTPGTLLFSADRGEEHPANFEAHLCFQRKAGGPGGLLSVSGSTRDSQGKSSSADASINLPAFLSEQAQSGVSENGPAANVGTDGEVGGSGTSNQSESQQSGAGEAAATYRSVLKLFEEYRGGRGLGELRALFERSDPRIMQEPPIALSDGNTPVRVALQVKTAEGRTPGFALRDADLVSVARDGEQGWVVTVLPNKGSSDVVLLLREGEELVEIPLLVAAPLSVPQEIDESNFPAALNAYLAPKEGSPRAEGLRTPASHLLYTFTANYLASHRRAPTGQQQCVELLTGPQRQE